MLVEPSQRLKPYDVTLDSMGRDERRRWAADVAQSFSDGLEAWRAIASSSTRGENYLEFGLIESLMWDGAKVHGRRGTCPWEAAAVYGNLYLRLALGNTSR